MKRLFVVNDDSVDAVIISRRTKHHYWADDTFEYGKYRITEDHFDTFEAAYREWVRRKKKELLKARQIVAQMEDALARAEEHANNILGAEWES